MKSEDKINGKFLRTVLTPEVYARLEAFCKTYQTGLEKWDFGIGIQVLLDFFEQHSSVAQINMKLDAIVTLIQGEEPIEETPKEEVKEENQGIEMLGGEIIKNE